MLTTKKWFAFLLLAWLLATAALAANQTSPAIVYDEKDNQYLVAWVDDRNLSAGRGTDIYGRLVDADGNPLGDDLLISGAPRNQTEPQVVFNSTDDQYLVVWLDGRSTTSGVGLFGQIVNSDGSLYGDELAISTTAPDHRTPSVAYNGADDQYFVVWEDGLVRGQMLHADGSLAGNASTIVAASGWRRPSVAYNSQENEYLVTFTSGRFVIGQIVNGEGSLKGEPFRVWTAPLDISFMTISEGPVLAYNSNDDQYLVIWAYTYAVGKKTSASTLAAQLVASDGVLLGNWFTIQPSEPGRTRVVGVAARYNPADNEYLIVWGGATQFLMSLEYAVRGRRIANNGAMRDVFLITRAPEGRERPSLDYNSQADQYLVVWQDGRERPMPSWHLFGQLVNFDGGLLGENFRVAPDPNPSPKLH